MVLPLGELAQPLGPFEVLLREDLRAESRVRAAAGRGRAAGPVFAGQQSVGEREIRDEGDALPHALRKHFSLGLAVQQTVLVLHAGKANAPGGTARAASRSCSAEKFE